MSKFNNLNFYFAVVVIVLLGMGAIYMLRDYLSAIFIAIVLTFLVYPVYEYLCQSSGRKILSASAVLFGVLILILIPLTIIGGVFLNYVNNFDLSEERIENYENSIFELTGLQVSIADTLISFEDSFKKEIKSTLPRILSFTSNFLISTFIIFFVMFYLLIEKDFFLKYTTLLLPFSSKGSKHLINESAKVTKAVLLGQVFIALIQGLLGMFAFFVAGISGAFFWGIIMIILSLIPVVGAFLVWLPAGLLLFLDGNYAMGIFVLLWGALVVSQIDNFVRPKLVGKFADIHPLETFVGVLAGITTFGIIGVLLGPLFLSLFKTFVRIFVEEYVKK
jgi:predicted PurR-regulated permease PerM